MCPEIRQKLGPFMSNKTLIELWLQSHGYWLHDTRLKSRVESWLNVHKSLLLKHYLDIWILMGITIKSRAYDDIFCENSLLLGSFQGYNWYECKSSHFQESFWIQDK